ncbi:hypothetical protein [Burkholderia sp. Tr-20355]|uniref:hypothetical protein n=1 Tax=Burkholderia sp. Tr-20355 TaxID=2703895 RepID=UPI00197DC091|nr:hypothetical protein [Burkholderia sp. Tr-20355]MBN3738061.1 hypothetical protein [Burkholderia sp. Tr-20355]
MTHDQFSNPQRTVVDALKQAGFSVFDTQTLLRAVREPAEQSLAAQRRERIAAQMLAAFLVNGHVFSNSQAMDAVNAALGYTDLLIDRLDQ